MSRLPTDPSSHLGRWKVGSLTANTALMASGLPERARLLGTRDLRAAQAARLRAILAANTDTEFGRAQGFATIRTPDHYRERVPLTTWDDYAGPVARIAAGETHVLTAEAVRLLEPTSGSTAGTKLVPYTEGLQREFRRAIAAWVADLYLAHPRLRRGRAYWSVTPAAAARADLPATRVPIGFDDDAAYAGPLRAALLRAVFAVGDEAARAPSMDDFRRVTALGLLAAGDLTLASVWNPTFLTVQLDWMAAHARDLRPALPPDRRPAADAAARGAWDEVWPDLAVVSCWADAHAAAPARELTALLPHATLQPKGLLATEAFVSLPIEGVGPVLAARSHVVELLAGDRALGPEEAVVGRRYQLAVTTSGGLYRYRLGDEVEVTGWHGALPVLRFRGRADAVVDLVGEKLSEAHVIASLAAAGIAGFAVLSPEMEPAPHYVLHADAATAEEAGRLDDALRASFHYDHARRLGQLGPVEAVAAPRDAAARILDDRRATGQRLGDIKPSPLSRTSLRGLLG